MDVKRYFMRATRIIERIGDEKCDCDTPCQCVVYAADFDAVLKDRDALQGKLKVAIDTVKAHNDSCESMCGIGDQEGVACGYRPYFPRHCPECTLHDRIWDAEGRQLLHEALAQLDLPKSG